MTGIRTVFRVFIAVSGSISKKKSPDEGLLFYPLFKYNHSAAEAKRQKVAPPVASFVCRGTGMGVEIGLTQFVEGGVGVDLRGGNAFVAE